MTPDKGKEWRERLFAWMKNCYEIKPKVCGGEPTLIGTRVTRENFEDEIQSLLTKHDEELIERVEAIKNVTIDGCIYKSDVIQSIKGDN